MILAASRICSPDDLGPGWVAVDGQTLTGLGTGTPPGPVDVDLGALTVVPGFVDAHGHGGGGASFASGSAADARTAIAAHLAHGTTSQVASLVTDTLPELVRQVCVLADLVEAGELAGTHLEGPWLSPDHRGAHRPDLLRDPAPEELGALLAAGRGTIRMVTLAPELEHGPQAVRSLVAAGVVAALGHTDATFAQTAEALALGASDATHLWNAMRPVHHREPGPVAAFWAHATAFVEVIADGTHLHPAIVADTFRRAPRRVVLVTDAMAAAAAPDGHYRLGPMEVDVVARVARLTSNGAIAGSTLTMADAVRYAVQQAGVPWLAALAAATEAPARMLGLTGVGRLVPGSRADLVALDDELAVRHVLHRGHWVGPTPSSR